MLFIGIDPGVNTGFAVYDAETKELTECESLPIYEAFKSVLTVRQVRPDRQLKIIVEDARKRTYFGKTGRERAQGAGSIKRDCGIWEEFLKIEGFDYELVHPKNNRTKLKAKLFAQITKYTDRTNGHGRDAAMLVYGRKAMI